MAATGTATKESSPLNGAGDLKKESKSLEAFLNIPSVTRIDHRQSIDGGPINLTFHYSQRKLAFNARSTSVVSATLTDPHNLKSMGPASPPYEIKDSIVHSTSPSGEKTFVALKGEGTDVALFEIWNGPRCLLRLNVPNTLHGKLINDGQFSGGVSWSHNESQIAYVADGVTAQSLPEWGKQDGAENDTKTPKVTTKSWKGRETWESSWGERLTSTRCPCIYILNLITGNVTALQKLPDETSCGQPIWDPTDKGLLFVGWPHIQHNFNDMNLKLGFVHCRNRPCSLYYVPMDGSSEATQLTSQLLSAFIPVFAPNGETVIFYSSQHAAMTGIHESCVRVYAMEWKQALQRIHQGKTDFSDITRLIVDDVKAPQPPFNFPGFYVDIFEPMKNSFTDNEHIIETIQFGMQSVIVTVNINSGEITPWSPIGMTCHSYHLMLHADGVAIAMRSSMTTAPCLVMRRLDKDNDWIPLNDELQPQVESSVKSILDTLEQIPLKFQPQNYPNGKPDDPPPIDCEAVLIRNKNNTGPQPTLLTLHGGPHSTSPQAYSPAWMACLSLGISVMTVNYRGSIGHGTDFTMALPGQIGTVDVEDCIQAVNVAIDQGYADPARLAVSGGSHGGFLTGHLVGQYPDVFKCAILRNPALTLEHMIYTTDIPDWVFVEVFGPKGMELFSTMPKADVLTAMYEKSAAAYIDRVQTPLMFMLGALDARVPASDSLRYIQTLKSRKGHPEVHVVMFPEDSHGLDKPQTEFENIMNILWWLRKHGIAH